MERHRKDGVWTAYPRWVIIPNLERHRTEVVWECGPQGLVTHEAVLDEALARGPIVRSRTGDGHANLCKN